MSALRTAAVIATALLALAVRSLDLELVFGSPGEVFLGIADSAYHARRALYTFANFPDVLQRDPYIAYPDGAVVPMPPLYDWLVGALARGFGGGLATFECVAAWVSPVSSALSVLALYAAGRAVAGHGVALAAGALFALLPTHVESSRLGDVDSHAFVALLGAAYLASAMALLRARPGTRRFVLAALALALARAALALSWSGSLLYLGLGEASLALAAVVGARVPVLVAQAVSAAGAALLVAPAPVPIAGPLATTTLSWFHVAWLGYAAVAVGAIAGLQRARPARRAVVRLGIAAVVALALAGAFVLAIPGLAESLVPAVSFVGKQDSWAAFDPPALRPLFDPGAGLAPAAVARAHFEYGLLAYAIPLTPLAALRCARDPAVRGPAVLLAAWCAGLGCLALLQVRWGSDFAAAGSLGFALLLTGLARRLAPRAPAPLAIAAGAALLWPAVSSAHLPRLPGAWAYLRGVPADDAGFLPGPLSLVRFARMIRAATPETSGYLDAHETPEYGILCWPPHGHVLNYAARRATPANGFGPFLDRRKFESAVRFYLVKSEERAVAIAERLGARYVVTLAREGQHPEIFAQRLHGTDGSAVGPLRHVERLRLVSEGPPRGTPMPTAFPSWTAPVGTIPYKLFEIVAGATLEVRAPAGSPVAAELALATPSGRRFAYRAVALGDEDGVARLRVSYATQTSLPVRSEGPYRVRADGREMRVRVSDRDVRTAALIRVDDPPATR